MKPKDRESWWKKRSEKPRHAFGSSEAPAACGQDPYTTTYELVKSKITGVPVEKESNEGAELARKWGLAVEPALAEYYAMRTGHRPRKVHRIIQHPKHDFMYASLDYEVGAVNLECKSTQQWLGLSWGRYEWTDEVPFPVILQATHQMSCSGKKETHIPATVGGMTPRIYKVILDIHIEAMLVEFEHDLSEKIKREELPPFDWSHPHTPELVRRLFGVDENEKPVMLNDEAQRLVFEYEELGMVEKHSKEQRKVAQAKLRAMMEHSALGILPDGRTIRRKKITVGEHTVSEYEKEDFRILKKGSKAGLMIFDS